MAIHEIIANLKSTLLDCINCPSICCTASNDFHIYFTKKQVDNLFGENKEILIKNNKLCYDSTDDSYTLKEGPCPLLTPTHLCSVHNRKRELGLISCDLFPLALAFDDNVGLYIRVDYRCSGIEKNWSIISNELNKIHKETDVPIYIQYKLNNVNSITTLSKFPIKKNL